MLAIAGGKGGCGKTTSALGVAAAFARQRRSVLVADADAEMPDLHLVAGVEREPGLDAVAAGRNPNEVAQGHPTVSGLSILPATEGGGHSDSTGLFDRLSGATDAILLDAPAGAGPDAVAPLRAADNVVVVTTLDPACLRDTAKTAAMARQLGTTVAGVVVSRAKAVPEAVTELLNCPSLGAIPHTGRSTDPLADERVRSAYDQVVSSLQPKYL